MNAAAYNAELFQTSVMHVPTKEEADRSWRTLANCDETMLRELRRQWGCIAIPSSGANSTSSIYGAVASMRSMGYQVEHAEALLDAGAAAFHAENWAELAVITARVYAALRQAPEDPSHPSHQYRRYHTWEEYCAAVPKWFFCPPPDDMLRTILNNSSRMQRLVITGNPGCGKSTLTHALEETGLPTVSADALVAQLYAAGGEMADYLGRRFGERLLEDDGSVCKPALLEAMQQAPGLRKEVEQMVHALVRDAILAFWDKAEAEGKDCAVAEIPLYFECGWHKAGLPGALSLTVRCPREIRLQRIMATRGWSEEKAATLEAWQWPAERKEAASDLVVDNAGTPADAEGQEHSGDRHAHRRRAHVSPLAVGVG